MPQNNTQLRVALVVGSLGIGGAEKQAIYIARVLHKIGVDVRLFYSSIQDKSYYALLEQNQIAAIGYGESKNSVLRFGKLLVALGRFRPHILFSLRLYTNLYIAIAERLLGSVGLGSSRSSPVYEYQKLGRIANWMFKFPRYLVVNSYHAQSSLVSSGLVSPEKIFVLPNGIDLNDFDQRSGDECSWKTSNNSINILFVGRLVPVKRLDLLLNALALALESVPNLRLIVVGDGSERICIEQYISTLNLGGHVVMLGRRHDVAALLWQHATILVSCSDEEGFPNVIIEAMASRLPVITTPAGDSGVIVENERTGFVVPFGDTASIADRIIKLAQNPELIHQMGDAGRAKVEEEYSLFRLEERLFNMLHQIAHHQQEDKVIALLTDLQRKRRLNQ